MAMPGCTLLQPIRLFRFRLGSRANAYVLLGGGYFRRIVQFTQLTLAQTVVFDPWWGYFGPALISANQVLGTFTSNSGAFDVGGDSIFGPPDRGRTGTWSRVICAVSPATATPR